MVNRFLVPAGFKDSLNFETVIEHEYKNLIIKSFLNNGFSLIKAPLVEYSENLDINTLKIKTNKKKDRLSIRNDITPQIIRIASSRLVNKKRPLKLCYYGEVVRNKGSILRPERQFQQVGAEIIGTENYKADVEIINLAYQSLKNIGVKNIVIEISAPFFLDSILKKIKNPKLRLNLKKFIQQKNIENCLKLLKNDDLKQAMKLLYLCSGSIKNKKTKITKLGSFVGNDKEVKRLINISSMIKVSKNDMVNIDLFEIHKVKKYYHGIKFTFFAKGVRGEIAGGGRYNLSYRNNFETAIGYTCYMDTILRASTLQNKNKKILIPFNTDEKTKNFLIKKGYYLFKSFEESFDIKSEASGFGIKYFLQNKKVKKI